LFILILLIIKYIIIRVSLLVLFKGIL